MARVAIFVKDRIVFEFKNENYTMESIRENEEYADYINSFAQYIDCEENPETAVLPHPFVVTVGRGENGELSEIYNSTIEKEATLLAEL